LSSLDEVCSTKKLSVVAVESKERNAGFIVEEPEPPDPFPDLLSGVVVGAKFPRQRPTLPSLLARSPIDSLLQAVLGVIFLQ